MDHICVEEFVAVVSESELGSLGQQSDGANHVGRLTDLGV